MPMDTRTAQVALFVDGDNVRGQSWSALLEKGRQFGRLAVARLYMDFQILSDGGAAARAAGFEPHHILGKRTSDGFKSMVDVALACDAMSVLHEYPNITTLIMGSGDADFLPLITNWKRRGKHIVVMANASALSGELRQVADEVVTFGGGGRHHRGGGRRGDGGGLSRQKLRRLVLDTAGTTRLTDRETNQPLIRVDWLLEELHERHAATRDAFPDADSLAKLLVEDLPELDPMDARGSYFLLGSPASNGNTPPAESGGPDADKAPDGPSDEEVLEIFAELCREALPTDGSWSKASSVLNEGKRLLEDGPGLDLPRNRSTGWFRSLLENTEGVKVRISDGGQLEVRRDA